MLLLIIHLYKTSNQEMSLDVKGLISKDPRVLRKHNLNFDRLCKLTKWSNGVKILLCGERPSYLSNKTILTQNKSMVSELYRF